MFPSISDPVCYIDPIWFSILLLLCKPAQHVFLIEVLCLNVLWMPLLSTCRQGVYPAEMKSTSTMAFSSFVCTENECCNKYPPLPFKLGPKNSFTHCLNVFESNHSLACTLHLMLLCGHNGLLHSLAIHPFGTPFQITNAGSFCPLIFIANITVALPECPQIFPSTNLVPALHNVMLDISSKSTLVWSMLIIWFASHLSATIC